MNSPRREFLRLAAAAAAVPILPRVAAAQAYPAKPVRIVVGYPPGGPTDIFARLMGQWLTERMGQQFIVENRPGAGSTIGIQAVVNAPADGYTLVLISTSAVISAQYYKNLNFVLTRDIAPVCGIAQEPLVMVVNPAVAAKTVPEFIAEAKAKPGKFVMASVGNGTTPHLGGVLFMMMAGVEMLHVPYKGTGQAVTDLVGGQIDLMFSPAETVMQHVQAGRLKALAVTSAQRFGALPNLPTVAEAGVPGYEAIGWFGLFAPAAAPKDLVARISADVNKVLADPDVKQKMLAAGAEPHGMSPGEFAAFVRSEMEKWARLMKERGINPE
jgi:tripartite-type tricarboxylate transporter receptor subunit TctC